MVGMVQVPEEAARTALGMARAVTRGAGEDAHHLWMTSEDQHQVAQALAVLLANIVGKISEASGRPEEFFYQQLQSGIDPG